MDLGGLSNFTTQVNGLRGLILVTPQGLDNLLGRESGGYQPTSRSPDGTILRESPTLVFHFEEEQTITLESDITDHFSEDNRTLTDQIALKPEIVTTHGFIGELNDVVPLPLRPLKFLADKLQSIPGFEPQFNAQALIAYNTAVQLYNTAINSVNDAVATVNTIGGEFGAGSIPGVESTSLGSGAFAPATVQTKQQKMFGQFYGYWKTRTLFTVQTPWASFEDMAIKMVRAIQDPNTRMITDFNVTFRKINFAETVIVGATIFAGRAATQASSLADRGPINSNRNTASLRPKMNKAAGKSGTI